MEKSGYYWTQDYRLRGSGVSGFKEGDKVGFICAVGYCFECEPCKKVHNSWCVTGKQKMQGFSCNGYFQECVCVDARNTMVLPEELDVTLAAQLELKIAG